MSGSKPAPSLRTKTITRHPIIFLGMILATTLACTTRSVQAEQVFQLKNGLVLEGTLVEMASLKEGFGAASANESPLRPVWMIDDGLRRHFVHGKGMVIAPPIEQPNLDQEIEFWQPKPLGGKGLKGLGSILARSEFNDFGRRTLRMRTAGGPVTVIQGIQKINPRYAKLIAVKPPQGEPTLLWDSRIATSTLDSKTLNTIFRRRLDQTDLGSRLEVVRFFIATKRYGDAKVALQAIIEDFPEEQDLKKQLRTYTERQVAQLLDEAKRRDKVGQHELAKQILDNFPIQDLGRRTRFQIEDARKEITDTEVKVKKLLQQLETQVQSLVVDQQDALKEWMNELRGGLSADTISRLSDYDRLGDSETLPVENRIALAISGWLLGSGGGEQNLKVATGLISVRNLVAQYLRTEDAGQRKTILERLVNLEGAVPQYVDRMLPLLVPTLEWPEGSSDSDIKGLYRVKTERADYAIQLPPEYNPLRSYPCIVSLHPGGGTPEGQVNWWSGPSAPNGGNRLGHAARNGFIVVAPQWSRLTQGRYEYTPAEHERVLRAFRDAMRRSSIDSDRVFLAGLGEGGTAAWDISLAHPDLWAGMISISGTPKKTVNHFEKNSRYIPLYLVMGQYDENRAKGGLMDDYLSFRHDAMVVMYRGRGREFFHEEIPRFFDWMTTLAHKRRAIPGDFEVDMIRRGDQFYWWLELLDLKPGTAVDPILWNRAKRIRSKPVEGSINKNNQIRFKGPANRFRLSLRPLPGILDLNQEVVVYNGARPIRVNYENDLETMLEDVRRRADRKRAVWLEVTIP